MNRLVEELEAMREASDVSVAAEERALEAARKWGHKVREILKNTLLTETVMNTLGLSIAIAFLHWGADSNTGDCTRVHRCLCWAS